MSNYIEILDQAFKKLNNPHCDLDELRLTLTNALEEIIPIIEPDKRFFSFSDFVEYYLFNARFNSDERYTVYEEPIHKIYYVIGLTYLREKDFDEAKRNFKEAIKWNPFDSNSYFELIDIYRKENDFEKMKITLFELHKYIYYYKDLGSFYVYLGDYAFLTKQLEIANICYSYASYFVTNSYLDTMLLKISGELKRAVINYTKEECISKLNQLQIPINATRNNVDELYKMFTYYKNSKKEYNLYRFLKENLYNLTNNEIFEDNKMLKNSYFKFTFEVPESWHVLDKTEYNKNSTGNYTLYVLKLNSNTLVNFDVLKDVQSDLISEYQQFRNFIANQGYQIMLENEVDAKNIKYIQMISQRKLLNEYVTMINCVFILNNKLFNLSVPTFNDFNEINIKKAFEDQNVTRLFKIINSIHLL